MDEISLPPELIKDFKTKQVIPIIGSGFSKNANSDICNWDELARKLHNKFGDDEFESPLVTLTTLEKKITRGRLINSIQEILDLDNLMPGETHHSFCKIPFDTIITTNFDKLLEKSFDENDIDYCSIYSDDDLMSAQHQMKLIKLHGDFDHKDKLVITASDYENYYTKRPLIHNHLISLFSTHTIVLFGYSFHDKNIQDIWNYIRESSNQNRPIYCFSASDEMENEVFLKHNVRIIPTNGTMSEYPIRLKNIFAHISSICGTSFDDEHDLELDELMISEQFKIGSRYETGNGLEQNYTEALKRYKQIAELNTKNASNILQNVIFDAQFKLGSMYEEGKGVDKNDSKAINWYTEAAKKGHVEAQFKLGLMYENGSGVKQNYDEAINWYTEAAKKGHTTAQFNLGSIYELKCQDYTKMAELYMLAAKSGHPNAQCRLGWMYENGKGVDQDNNRSIKWYILSAMGGNNDAAFYLGRIYQDNYESGGKSSSDIEKSLKWYRFAAKNGNVYAQNRLGTIYEEGIEPEIPKDLSEAEYWYHCAADQGSINAQYGLGHLFEFSQDPPDYNKAIEWYAKASKNGHKDAEKRLSKLNQTPNWN